MSPLSPQSSSPRLEEPLDAQNVSIARTAARSLTLRGAVAMVIAYSAGRFGLDLGAPAANEIAARALDLIFTLGVMAVGVGRARAKGPLT